MSRETCWCAPYRKPCSYHEGWADALGSLVSDDNVKKVAGVLKQTALDNLGWRDQALRVLEVIQRSTRRSNGGTE